MKDVCGIYVIMVKLNTKLIITKMFVENVFLIPNPNFGYQ